MSTAPLIRRPTFDVSSTRRYRLSPRAKRSFNTPLDAANFIDPNQGRMATVRIDDSGEDDIVLNFDYPLTHGRIEEVLVVRDMGRGLMAQRLMRTIHGEDDQELRREEVDFASGTMPLPEQSYPEVTLPFLLSWQPFDGQQRQLYAWINDRFVAKVQYQSQGEVNLDLPGGRRRAVHTLMWPDLNDWVPLGRVLTRMAYPFVPKYRMWFDPNPPHAVLRFEGPYGPPGAPEIVLEYVEG